MIATEYHHTFFAYKKHDATFKKITYNIYNVHVQI